VSRWFGLVAALVDKGLGEVRTDSAQVLAAVRDLNRLELAGEAVRAALETLAAACSGWPKPWMCRAGRPVTEVRRGLYTANAIESFNYQIRKIVKNRGQFPTDDAMVKLVWLAIAGALAAPVRAAPPLARSPTACPAWWLRQVGQRQRPLLAGVGRSARASAHRSDCPRYRLISGVDKSKSTESSSS
jgi:hypothetical protein